jgi:hypothetical protein
MRDTRISSQVEWRSPGPLKALGSICYAGKYSNIADEGRRGMVVGKRAWGAISGGIVTALGLVFATTTLAVAADLGGDCCADLEERIAELEASTVRKGNRKVSVTVSGWINEAVFLWDDGTEHNAYVGTNFVEQSRFRFVGEAKIDKDWSAGYVLEFGGAGHPSNQWDQGSQASNNANPFNQDRRVITRKSNWYLKNKDWGQFAVGLNAMATYHLLDDADPTLTRNIDPAEGASIFMAAFQIRIDGQFVHGLKWSDILRGFNNLTPGDSARRHIIRYDTPTYKGFSAAATWGEDDVWDTMLNYKDDIGDFTLVARAGYGASTDPGQMARSADPAFPSYVYGGTACISGSTTVTSLPNFECTWEAAGGTIWHKLTGLYLYGGWGRQSVHTDHIFPQGTIFDATSTDWFLQPGIERKWCELGKTVVFGEYRHDDPGSNPGKTVDGSINFWQGGVVQNFENADMNLYVVYEYTDGSVTGNSATAATGAPVGTSSLDPFKQIIIGAKINF